MSQRDYCGTAAVNYELYFLITKYLEAGPCQNTAKVLKEELTKHEILPKRHDWEGDDHEQSFSELEKKYPHIGAQHLAEICNRIGPLLDKEIPPCISGINSLLGTGRQSIMRKEKDERSRWRSLVECSIRRHQRPFPSSISCIHHHIVKVLHGREISGPFSRKQAFPPKLYSRMQLLCRTLGHLSSVYCVLFDGTGKYVLTGADDMLIKVWSAIDGRLLATLRGVLSELTDIAINVENTLLAAGSVDRIIRVWCLQTAFPVAVLMAHSGMITGVNFCPGVVNGMHYLASTSTDGSVAFWSYTVGPNKTVNFHPRALQYNERMRPGQAQMICASFSPGGIFMAAGSADHHVRVYKMIGDSEGEGPHRILETETHSDRVDSIQWAHSGLRFISGSKDGTAVIWKFTRQRWKTLFLNMTTKLPGKSEASVDPKLKLKVTMVCWNSNDQWAITACNDHSIKVWSSESATLYEVLKGHKDEVFVLESHPYDPNVLLSAGHDGLIMLWDLLTGTQLASFQNSIEGQPNGAVFDAKWSPDGTMMAATDSHGHILLFGLGFVNDRIKKLPKELFFHTDYRPLVRDASHNVLDEQTQVAPHLMPPPFLVDIDGNPYPPYLQRLVPGRENCRTDQLVPNIIMSNDGQQEVIEGLSEPRSTIDQMIQELVQRSEPQSYTSPYSSRQSTSPRSRLRGRGDVEGVRQSSGNWQRDEFTWTQRRLITPLDKGSLQTVRQKVQFHASLELDEYKWEMQRTMEFKPAPMTSSEFIKRPRKRHTHAYRTRASRVEQLQSQFENPDGFSASASEESQSSSHNDSTARSEDLGSSSSETSSSEYSDWIADHGLEPPKRNKRTCKKRQVPKPAIAAKKQNVEVPEVYRPSEWLSEVIPKKFPYYPQMGDEVMFFKEGYQLYLDAVGKRQVYELQPSQITPWGKIHIREPELVKVIGIKYELRPPRLCCLRLAVMKQNGKLTGDRFSIKYHDVPDVIDFLVLRQTYETAIARNWDVGERFRSMIDNGWWWGKILSRRPDAQSDFLSYFIRWDNREEENMSPWDMEPVDPNREPADEGGSLSVLAEEIAAILYHPQPDEWPGGNRDTACDRILRGLDDIMGLSVAEPFIAPVDINEYPSYAFIVEYPIDLSTIKARFENRFYRRVTAAQFDVRYLATNAEKFNEEHSPIVRHARIVSDLCLKVIKELSDIDVPVVYRQLLEAYRSSESSDETVPRPSTSGLSARSLRASRRSRPQSSIKETTTPFDWRRACREMIESLWASRDSEPFREPVDRLEHPDYDKVISTPMDLWTVREELRGDNYQNPPEFYKDVRLIFANSKKYSPDTRSRIYAMTVKLSNLAEELMDNILEKWRASRRKNRGAKPKRKVQRKVNSNVLNGTASDSEEDISPSSSSVQKQYRGMRTRVMKKEVNYTMSSTGSEYDDKEVKHAVNGFPKRKLYPRSARSKKVTEYNTDNQDDEEYNVASERLTHSQRRFNSVDHTYHSNISRGRVNARTGENVSEQQRRARKRPKPPSESESSSPKAGPSSSRPKRSVKRKNYAAMIASGSESEIVEGAPKKIVKIKTPVPQHRPQTSSNNVGMRTRPLKKHINYEENGTLSSNESEGERVKHVPSSRARTRPMKKEVNYDENGTVSSSHSFDDQEESFTKRRKKKAVNGFQPRVIRSLSRKCYNKDEDEEEEEEEDDDLDEEEEKREIPVRDKGKSGRDFTEDANSENGVEEEDDNEDSSQYYEDFGFTEDDDVDDNDEKDDDYKLPSNPRRNKVNQGSRRRRSGKQKKGVNVKVSSARRSNNAVRSRKRRKMADSESDEEDKRVYGSTSRPHSSRPRNLDGVFSSHSRLRRSKRPHRPLRDESEDSFSSDNSEDKTPQLSVSSRGRIRKISPRVRAFLRE